MQGWSVVAEDRPVPTAALGQDQCAHMAPGGTWPTWQNKRSLAGHRNENEVADSGGSSAMGAQEPTV